MTEKNGLMLAGSSENVQKNLPGRFLRHKPRHATPSQAEPHAMLKQNIRT